MDHNSKHGKMTEQAKKISIHLLTAAYYLIFGLFLGMAGLSTYATLDLSKESQSEFLRVVKLMLVLDVLLLVAIRMLGGVEGVKNKEDHSRIFSVMIFYLLPIFMLYEVLNALFYGIFNVTAFPSLFVNLFFLK